MYVDGCSLRDVAEWLDGQIPAPQGDLWSGTSLSSLFRNQVLIGRRTDARGRTVLRMEPLIDRATWDALQARQAAKARRTGARPKAMLAGIAVCGLCDGPMYRLSNIVQGTRYTYYRCHGDERKPSQCRNMIRLETLDAQVEEFINGSYGDHPRFEIVTVPGHGYEDEIAEVERDLRELDCDGPGLPGAAGATAGRAQAPAGASDDPARAERVLTGDTIRDYCATLGTDGKREYLNRISMHVKVPKGERPVITIWGGPTGLRPSIEPIPLRA